MDVLFDYLEKREVDAMIKIFPSPDMLSGARALVRAYGYGPLTPNTILLGDTENRENFTDFAELIQLVYRTERNLIMLKEGSNPERTDAEEIHVWWGGNKDNIGLILTLAYQIQKSPVWHESKLIVKTIVSSDAEREAAVERLETYLEEQRIPAEARVRVKDERSYYDIIRKTSENAGLVFMGMRPPLENETHEEYGRYYANLMGATNDMPPLAFVLAAEDIEFRQVIGISGN